MENLTKNQENLAYRRAFKRVKDLKSFYGNLTSYVLIIPFLAIINMITSPSDWWFYWPMLGWGLGIILHAIQVFGLGKNWEEKKLNELLSQDFKNSKSN